MNKRALFIGLGVLGIVLIVCFGTVVVGAAAFFLISDRESVSAQTVFEIQVDEPIQDSHGMLVSGVVPGSPADEAGLTRGDIIYKINGESVGDEDDDFSTLLEEFSSGDRLRMSILHGDEMREINLVVGERNGSPYLGIEICQSDFDRRTMILPQAVRGVIVTEVVTNSPAESAGLEVGDRITSFDGVEIDADNPLTDIISEYQPGDQVVLDVQRVQGTTDEIIVVLGENPYEPSKAYLGITFYPAFSGELSEQDFHHIFPFDKEFQVPEGKWDWMPFERGFGFPFSFPSEYDRGLIIYQVIPDSPADISGLTRGDLILELNGAPIISSEQFTEEIQSTTPGDEITLKIYRIREQETIEITVTLEENPDNPGKTYLGVSIFEIAGESISDGEEDGGFNLRKLLPFSRLNPLRWNNPYIPEETVPDLFKDILPKQDL